MNPFINITNIDINLQNDHDQLNQNVHIQESDRVETLSLHSMNVSAPSPPTATELQMSSTTVPTKKRQIDSDHDTNVLKRHHTTINASILDSNIFNHHTVSSDLVDGCNIFISESPTPNVNQIEIKDFLHGNKISSDFLIYAVSANSVNDMKMETIKRCTYKVFFIVQQDEERRKDFRHSWHGSIYPDKNNSRNDVVLDTNATFYPNSNKMIYTIEELNTTSTNGLRCSQVVLIRTDLLQACQNEDENILKEICDVNGVGMLRVIGIDDGTVLMKRQSFEYIKKDTTSWNWLRSNWVADGERHRICLATFVAATIYGKAPANPVKDPCIAKYNKNGREIQCYIEISLSGILRSGRIINKNINENVENQNEKVKMLKAYKEKNGDFSIVQNKDRKLYNIAYDFRMKKDDGKLSKEIEKKLNDIGFDWNVRKHNDDNEKVQMLKAYKEKNGDFGIDQKKNQSLYYIAYNFRMKKDDGKLSKEIEKKLNDIGFDWNVRKHNDDNEKVKMLKAYKEEKGDFKFDQKRSDYDYLYNIAYHFRLKKDDGKLSKKIEKKLNDIGFDWNVRKYNNDNEKVQMLKAYKEKNGDFGIDQRKNQSLYNIAYSFRVKKDDGKLSKEIEKKLNDIRFDWDNRKKRRN